jgi:hypothetical protein
VKAPGDPSRLALFPSRPTPQLSVRATATSVSVALSSPLLARQRLALVP